MFQGAFFLNTSVLSSNRNYTLGLQKSTHKNISPKNELYTVVAANMFYTATIMMFFVYGKGMSPTAKIQESTF